MWVHLKTATDWTLFKMDREVMEPTWSVPANQKSQPALRWNRADPERGRRAVLAIFESVEARDRAANDLVHELHHDRQIVTLIVERFRWEG